MTLFAKIDTAFVRDIKVRRAGPLGRLLYLQLVLRWAETSDPYVPARSLDSIAVDIPEPLHLMRSLADLGMVDDAPGGWLLICPPDTVRRGKRRRSLTPADRLRIRDRDNGVCGICGEYVEMQDMHIDHITPFSRNGSDSDDNLQTAHSWCNQRKAARMP